MKAAGPAVTRGPVSKPLPPKLDKMGISTKAPSTGKFFTEPPVAKMLEKKPPAVGNFSPPNSEKKPPAVGNSSPPNSEKFAKKSMKAAELAITKDKPLEKFANKSIKAAGLADTRGKPLKPKAKKLSISTKAHSTSVPTKVLSLKPLQYQVRNSWLVGRHLYKM